MLQVSKITAQEATAAGYIDALDIIKNPERYDSKAYRTAVSHINRYVFAKRFVRNKKVIDVACGTGYGCEIFNKNNCREYVGIDISKENIQQAKKRYSHLNNTTFLCDDLTEIRNFSLIEKCDIFVSFETIEHLSDYDSFLKFVFFRLKKRWSFYCFNAQ